MADVAIAIGSVVDFSTLVFIESHVIHPYGYVFSAIILIAATLFIRPPKVLAAGQLAIDVSGHVGKRQALEKWNP